MQSSIEFCDFEPSNWFSALTLKERNQLDQADFSWLARLKQGFEQFAPSSHPALEQQNLKLLNIAKPLIVNELVELQSRVAALKNHQSVFDAEQAIAAFIPMLLARLSAIAGRTLVLEMHVAKSKGLLHGDTPEARFNHFVERLTQPQFALSLLQEYPVLARKLVTALAFWSRFCLSFLGHVAADQKQLAAQFCPAKPLGKLISLGQSTGDTHNQGRCVIIANFDSDTSIVYKPRSLAVEVAFQKLLRWINNTGLQPTLKTITVLERQHYGWCEYIKPASCETQSQVEQYYQRFGALLAILYGLEATDIHGENIIACAAHPVIIDLEALFHQNDGADTPNYSVLSTAILPQKSWGDKNKSGIDISGLGGFEAQTIVRPTWQGNNTDQMQLASAEVNLEMADNRVLLNGQAINPYLSRNEIVTGFSQAYQLLEQHKQPLFQPNGLMANFKQVSVRYIQRNTHSYEIFLQNLNHPQNLGSGLAQDQALDDLWVGSEFFRQKAPLIEAEAMALSNGDIPLLVTEPHSLHLQQPLPIANVFHRSAYERVQRRIEQFSQKGLTQQLRIISDALATLNPDLTTKVDKNQRQPLQVSSQPINSARLLAEAGKIAAWLADTAVTCEHKAQWVGFTQIGEQWSVYPLAPDLYEGQLGVILFLAIYAQVSGDDHYKQLAQDGLNALAPVLTHLDSTFDNIGAFNGWGGVIYTLGYLYHLWSDESVLTLLIQSAGNASRLIEQDQHYDVMSGAAGYLLASLCAYKSTKIDTFLQQAQACGDHLLSKAKIHPCGISWPINDEDSGWAGMSHGAAGIAMALGELFTATKQKKYQQGAERAVEYENTLYSDDSSNWQDLRVDVGCDHSHKTNAWCHGGAGIALARMALSTTSSNQFNKILRRDITQAKQGILAQGFDFNHSLCHGSLGNLAVLQDIAQFEQDDALQLTVTQWLNAVVKQVTNIEHWQCGNPIRKTHPSLMTGLSGIGWSLLYFAAQGQLPSLLRLNISR